MILCICGSGLKEISGGNDKSQLFISDLLDGTAERFLIQNIESCENSLLDCY